METVEVTARFDLEGKAHPIRFTWQGQSHDIESVGRQWEDGESQHILVMTAGGQAYELIFFRPLARWYLGRFNGSRQAA